MQTSRWVYGSGCAALLGLLCLRCGADDSAASDLNFAGPGIGGPNQGSSQGGTGVAVGAGSEPPRGGSSASSGGAAGAPVVVVPPETEIEQSFLAPVVSGKYVFSANPKSGRVAVIDAETYGVRLFNAGFGPKYLTALPGGKAAIVINYQSHDTTLFRLAGDEVTVDEHALPVHGDANAWAVSPNGRFAIAWTRSESNVAEDPTAGSQDVTVLDLDQSRSTRLSVGFNPTQVSVDTASTRAFVVNDEGISVVTLGDKPLLSSRVRVSDDPLEEQVARDVSITPDGDFAVVRIQDSSALRLVDLVQDTRTLFDLGGPIADVDLSADGQLAIAALPTLSEVVLLPLPLPLLDAAATFEHLAIPGEIASSVALSAGSELAMLYQNGADNSHITLLDLREGAGRAYRTIDVKGPVSAVFAAPLAASAIAFQRPMLGSTKAGLFSSIPTLGKRSAKIVGTDAAPSSLAFSADGKFALVTVGNDKTTVHGVYRVRLDTLQEDFLALASPPSPGATGIVEAVGRGFVAQAHPEGRITFVDLATARAHTITGFELAARILD